MRILLRLKAEKSVSQKIFSQKYYNAMNACIYDIFSKSTSLASLHDEQTFKKFCFGNVYPVKNETIKEGETYSVIISSASPKIIETLFLGMPERLNLGEGLFSVLGSEIRTFDVTANSVLETVSILHLRGQDGKPILFDKDETAFKDALKKHLIHKYNSLTGENVSLDFDVLKGVGVSIVGKRKNYSIPIEFEQKRYNVIGNKLRFSLNGISDEQLAVIKGCFDAGFGEKNSYGMGFMVVRR